MNQKVIDANHQKLKSKLKYIDAMYQVKPLHLIPGFNAMNTDAAAEYFETTPQVIRNAQIRKSRLLEEVGSKVYSKIIFDNSDYDEVISMSGSCGANKYRYGDIVVCVGNRGARMYPPEAVFLLAMSLQCKVAEQIRAKVEELESKESDTIEENNEIFKEDVAIEFKKRECSNNRTVSEFNEENNLKVFDNPEFGTVRTVIVADEPWFVGKDITAILGYSNSRDALSKRVDDEDKIDGVAICDSIGRKQTPILINESGLYSLVLSSKLPTARQFRRWITSEVIPSIRKHGAYMTPETIEKVLSDPDTIIRLATDLKNERLKTQSLSAANAALTMEANTWDDRYVLNALIRAFGSSRCDGDFAKSWNVFYKKFNYANHTNVRARRPENSRKRLLDFIHPDEIKSALRVAAAMCEEAGIPTGDVINQTNLKRISV